MGGLEGGRWLSEEKELEMGSETVKACEKDADESAQNQASCSDAAGAEGLRLASVAYLKESILLCVSQLRNSRVRGGTKIKWAHCLAQQIAALVNLTKGMGLEGDEDLAVWLAEVRKKIPKKYVKSVSVGDFDEW